MKVNVNKIFIAMGVVILLLIGVVIYQVHTNGVQSQDMAAFQQALSNDFKTYKNSQGQEIAEVKAAVFANSPDLKAAIAQLNKNGANIQSKVSSVTESLILLDKKVGGLLEGKTTIAGYDTVKSKLASTDTASYKLPVNIFPIYSLVDSTKWYNISGLVYHDHFKIAPYFKDSTEIKADYVPNGLFKRKVLTAYALSKNPYSKTTGFKSIVVKKEAAPIWKYITLFGVFAGGVYTGIKVF